MITFRGLPRSSSRGFISLGLILVLIIAAAVIGGAAYYAGSQSPTTSSAGNETASTTQASSANQPAINQPTNSFANLCAAYAHLKKGDTDATTGGQVSKLQAFLGISPTTGSYGALTSIGYTNKCVGGNASPSSVAGMSKYTDADFGFSFWYPSVQQVRVVAAAGNSTQLYGPQTQIKKTISTPALKIDEVYSPTGQILGDMQNDPSPVSSYFYYFFDTKSGQWMEFSDGAPTGKNAGTNPADTSNNTMGGLHIFPGYTRFGLKSIIPLSANDFLVIWSVCDDATDYSCAPSADPTSGGSRFTATVKTIVATDPTVAIPVSTAEQIAAIQAEARAYGGGISAQENSKLQALTPLSGVAPLTVTFMTPPSAGGDYVSFGDGTDGCSITGAANNGMTGCDVSNLKSFAHTYTKPGTYTVTVSRLLPSSTLGTAIITVY